MQTHVPTAPTVSIWVKAKSKHKLKYKVKFKFKWRDMKNLISKNEWRIL